MKLLGILLLWVLVIGIVVSYWWVLLIAGVLLWGGNQLLTRASASRRSGLRGQKNTTGRRKPAPPVAIESKTEHQKRMHREWMQGWVDLMTEDETWYIRKQPGISEAEVAKRLLHWEWRKIQNKAKYW